MIFSIIFFCYRKILQNPLCNKYSYPRECKFNFFFPVLPSVLLCLNHRVGCLVGCFETFIGEIAVDLAHVILKYSYVLYVLLIQYVTKVWGIPTFLTMFYYILYNTTIPIKKKLSPSITNFKLINISIRTIISAIALHVILFQRFSLFYTENSFLLKIFTHPVRSKVGGKYEKKVVAIILDCNHKDEKFSRVNLWFFTPIHISLILGR